MPAGHGKQCRTCYWKALLEKRLQIDCVAFSSLSMAAHFRAFGDWLGEKVGVNKAAITVHHYLPFFSEVERQWKDIPEYAKLLAHFGSAKLRRLLLPMRWMEATGLVVTDGVAKADNSDRRRIAATLDRLAKGTEGWLLLEGYHKLLIENLKGGKITLRSIRLALSPAATLLCQANRSGRMPPDQRVLDAYLAKTPGQRAGISGFVRYLREVNGAQIELPKPNPDRGQKQRRKKLETELIALMQERDSSDQLMRQWLSVALAYFHGLPKRVVSVNWKSQLHLSEDGDGLVFRWDGREYFLPVRNLE